MVIIKVDTREHEQELFDAFDRLADEKGFTWEKEALVAGDVVCGNIVVERKTAQDFLGSIMSDRLSEQAAKMCLNFEHKYIIIEGDPFMTTSRIHPNAIIGKMTSLAVKYNIKMIYVNSPTKFVYACWSLITKHLEEGRFDPNEHIAKAYEATTESIVINMLSQIPRLGAEKATIIADKYGHSIAKMSQQMTKKDLCDIEGIGDVLADRVMGILTK